MQMRRLAILLFCLLPMAALLYGCGSSSKSGGSINNVATVSESSCMVCHATSIEPVTGRNIVEDYLASAHNTVPGARAHYPDGVGCQGCHGGGAQHNGVGPIPFTDPSASGQCFSCHKNYLNSNHYAEYPAPAGTSYSYTGAAHNAQYVSANYQNACTACHDPHKADQGITQEHHDWAESGHGDVAGAAWEHYDFKLGADCIACHTSTGFINYVKSGFTVPTATWASPTDGTHEVLTCQACHTDYNFGNRVRSIGAVKAYKYTYAGQAITFPDVSASNLCVTCHSGRGNTQSAKSARFQGHHAPAAGILFNDKSHIGFEFSGKVYTNAGFVHASVGVANAMGTGTSGPCVTCHMDAATNANSHKFSAATKNAAGTITAVPTQAVCLKCHADVAGLDTLRLGYTEAGQLLKAYVANTVTNYLAVAITSTNYNTVADNAYGAYQNSMLSTEEAGAYAHNSKYAKRLIFDSIDWMDNGAFNNTITIPVEYPNARAWFGADAAGVVASRP